MLDPNSIIDARSASPLAPDLVASSSYQYLRILSSSPTALQSQVQNAVQYNVLDRIVSRIGTGKGVCKRLLYFCLQLVSLFGSLCVVASCCQHQMLELGGQGCIGPELYQYSIWLF